MIKTLLYLLLTLLIAVPICWSQESRGSIAGRITDPQGAAIPGATVIVTNVETNVINRATSNVAGIFEVNLLNPGQYTVSVVSAGFSKAVRSGLVLNVAGRLDLEFQLQVGQVSESIEVTAAAPLLDTTTASGGRVIDQKQIVQLPVSNLNPFTLSALAPGMQWTGQPEFRRPSDNGGTSSFNTSGNVGQNEYTIDGAPVTGTNRRVGFVPPSDGIEEFKLETTAFDASYGHSSGATINVMTKAGTNAYHGSLYDQHWQQRWNATPHFTRLAFEDAVRQGKAKPGDQKQTPGRSNNFGATLGGPVRVPKIYNGTNRFFFFFSYNGSYESKPDSDSPNRTVPKMAWRQGDFSDMQAIDATKYTIYDPRSARREGSRVVRTPFPGNKGIPVLNPVYKYYGAIYPVPNNVPGVVTPEGSYNYLNTISRDLLHFNSIMNRFDYNISDRQRLFGRWFWNRRLTDTRDWAFSTRPGLLADGTQRFNKGVGGGFQFEFL
ncbi:MAG: carboxypeptidase-like regulatory domain-containing protein, partial [Acidobacteria bacterium]|nr:carboxypeptidase-like regulatory domain-containing protein [Acidobacteriota bacterium]